MHKKSQIMFLGFVSLVAILLSACPPLQTQEPTLTDWEIKLNDPIAANPVILDDGSILIITYHGKLFRITETATSSPKENLIFDFADTCIFPPVVASDGSAYVCSGTGRLYKILTVKEPTTLVWKSEVKAPRTNEQQLVIAKDSIYLIFDAYRELVAYNKTDGAVKFTIDLKNIFTHSIYASDVGYKGEYKIHTYSSAEYELVVYKYGSEINFISQNGTNTIIDISDPNSLKDPKEYPYTERNIGNFITTKDGLVALSYNTTYTSNNEYYSYDKGIYHLIKIAPEWTSEIAWNMPLEKGISDYSISSFRLINNTMIEGGKSLWNLSDGKLIKNYPCNFAIQDPNDFSPEREHIFFHTIDETSPYIWFEVKRKNTAVYDSFFGMYPGNGETLVPRTIAFPDFPLIAKPIMVKDRIIFAYADGVVRAWKTEASAVLPASN